VKEDPNWTIAKALVAEKLDDVISLVDFSRDPPVRHEYADFVKLAQAVAKAMQLVPVAFVAGPVGNRLSGSNPLADQVRETSDPV
jgi:hypothetical protein